MTNGVSTPTRLVEAWPRWISTRDPVLVLHFDHPVDAAAVLPTLRVVIEGSAPPLRLATPAERARPEVREQLAGLDPPRTATFAFTAPLPLRAGVEVWMAGDRDNFSFSVHDGLRVFEVGCSSGPICRPGAALVVRFTTHLREPPAARPRIRVHPALGRWHGDHVARADPPPRAAGPHDQRRRPAGGRAHRRGRPRKGRRGAVLVATDGPRIPIVRTTTAYTLPAQCFQPIHTTLARQICACASLSVPFNNALLEVYTRAYATMRAHSDQALDLDDAGEIAVFSCYERPEAGPTRRLIVESKQPGGPTFVIPLLHGHVVVFSTATNRRFRHRIVLDPATGDPNNVWLGVTFRTSKTFINVRDGQPHLADGTPLTLANDEQRHEFLQLRRRENQETDFVYPRVTCTLSPSDLSPPEMATTLSAPAVHGNAAARAGRRR